MRPLSFPTLITGGDGRSPQLYLPIPLDRLDPAERSEHLAAMVAKIPYITVRPAIMLFAAAAGEPLPPAPFATGDAVVIPLPVAAVSEPWRAAVLLNLVDFALGNPDPETRLARGATLVAPSLVGITPDQAFADLARRMASARAAMTARLPPDFHLDEYEGANWPEDSGEYSFDVALTLSRALDMTEGAAVTTLAEDIETLIGWMGLALEETVEEWTDAGRMAYPGGIELSGVTLSYSAERPPSDPALALTLLEAALGARHGLSVVRWVIEINAAE